MGRIKDLTNTNAASTSDRFAIDDGASVRSITFDKLANQIINSYGPKLFGMRTSIPNGADLNEYRTPGPYECTSAAIAASLANCPVSNRGFKLLVLTQGYSDLSYGAQVIFVSEGGSVSTGYNSIYMRTYWASSGWTAWERLARASETAYADAAVALTLGSVSQNYTIKKYGRNVTLSVNMGSTSGTPFSGIENNPTIGTIPAGFRPAGTQQVWAAGQARTSGAWATANYFPIVCGIQTDGTIKIYGNTENLKTCQFITFSISYICA